MLFALSHSIIINTIFLVNIEGMLVMDFQKDRLDESAERLGISPEFLKKIEENARAEIYADDDWEKELDARNRARAGIAESAPSSKLRPQYKIPANVELRLNNIKSGRFTAYYKNILPVGANKRPPDCAAELFVLMDERPIFKYKIPFFCHACGISENGQYVAFQTANGVSEPARFMFFEAPIHKLLWQKTLPTGWKNIIEIKINKKNGEITIHYPDKYVRYDFFGREIVNTQ